MSFPLPGSRTAPSFDGTPEDLERYLDRIEYLTPSGSRDADKIDACLSYLSTSDYHLFKTCVLTEECDWDSFKTAVYQLYPGSLNGIRYTRNDLIEITKRRASTPMQGPLDFGEYQREFMVVANALTSRGLVSEIDIGAIFLSGCDPALREQIRHRLLITLRDHHPSSPYSLSQLRDAAEFILAGGPATSSSSIQGLPTLSPSTSSSASPPLSQLEIAKLTALVETFITSLPSTVY
ncbi:hypothetical protein ONZ45_g18628 [Pleurotus djamor]|nr:hypothetical protein ONZ45_g18628 [Pleurotus djamor]